MRPRLVLGAGMLLGGLLSSCAGSDNNNDLDAYLCDSETVGSEFQELARGDFSPRDLADLGDDAARRDREFRAAGMRRGRFVLFKETLQKPPFDPPANVVCQVIEFGSAQEAGAWAGGLRPDATLEAAIMGDVRSQGMTAYEDTPRTETIIGDGRRFLLTSMRDDPPKSVALRVSPDGSRVRLFAVGFQAEWIDPPWDSWPDNWIAWVRAER